MQRSYDEYFSVPNKPLVIANDTAGKRGQRILGRRTLLSLNIIEGLLIEEDKGLRTLSPHLRTALEADLVQLRELEVKPAPLQKKAPHMLATVTLDGKLCLNGVEMAAICALVTWAARDRCSEAEIEASVRERFNVSNVTQLKAEQYSEAVEFLIACRPSESN